MFRDDGPWYGIFWHGLRAGRFVMELETRE